MRIHGAGGCFDNRIYEIDADFAWQMVLLTARELDVIIDEQNDEIKLMKFHTRKKFLQVCIQQMDDETIQVIVDSTKKYLEIYSWNPEHKEVDAFYEVFEKKLEEYRSFVVCPMCNEKVSRLSRFCPMCGQSLK